jgi:hypothetical protein
MSYVDDPALFFTTKHNLIASVETLSSSNDHVDFGTNPVKDKIRILLQATGKDNSCLGFRLTLQIG